MKRYFCNCKSFPLDHDIDAVYGHLWLFYQLQPKLKHFADPDFACIPSPAAAVSWLRAGRWGAVEEEKEPLQERFPRVSCQSLLWWRIASNFMSFLWPLFSIPGLFAPLESEEGSIAWKNVLVHRLCCRKILSLSTLSGKISRNLFAEQSFRRNTYASPVWFSPKVLSLLGQWFAPFGF